MVEKYYDLEEKWFQCRSDPPDDAINGCTSILSDNDKEQSQEARGHAYVNRAQASLRKGDHERAIVDFDLAFRIDPQSEAVNNSKFHNSRAWSYHLADRDAEALPSAGKPRSSAPDNVAVLNTRGHIYVALGHLDKALADFEKAIGLDAEMLSAYMGRGLAHERKGDRNRQSPTSRRLSLCR